MEDGLLNQEGLEVCDPTVAALLLNPKAVVVLAPFLRQEWTLSQAAQQLGMKLPAVSYWVKKLLAAGILQQTRQQRRAGSSIRYYRSVSAALYVPYSVLPSAVVEVFQRQNQAELERRLHDSLVEVYGPWSGAWGVRIGLHPTGKATLQQVSGVHHLPDPAAAALSLWDGLRLSAEDARNLQRDLQALLERYRQREGVETYLVRIAVAPIMG